MKSLGFVIFLLIHRIKAENYTVSSVLEPSYMIDNGDGTFSGFMVDLLNGLSKVIGFSYDITINPDNMYGQETNGKWNGLIGELLDDTSEVHIAAAPLIISSKRQSVVPFTRPFHRMSHRILIKKPVVQFHSLSVLFQPFSLQLWIMVIVICLIISSMLFIVNKFSPSEWSQVQPEDDPTNARDSFSARNVSFFVHSTLTWQGYKEVPRSPAGRILVTMWFSFVFFMVISYIANLTAFLIARDTDKPVVPFKTWEEMATQSSVPYGFSRSSVFYRHAQEQADVTLQHITRNILTSDTIFSSYDDAVKKIRQTDGKFAAIVPTDKGTNYANNKPCDLMMVGASVMEMPYAMACKKEQICNSLSMGISRMMDNGELQLLISKWLEPKSVCPPVNLDDYVSRHETAQLTARPLTIADASLAFVVLLIGLVFSIIFLVIEVLVHRRRKTKSSNISTVGNTNKMTALDDVEKAALTDEQEKAPIASNEA